MGKADSRPPQPAAATKPAAEEAAAVKATAAAAPPGSGSGLARVPKSSAPPLTTSRTATLDDPLTTSLLAEIARRPATVEMTPAQLAAARAMAPGAPEPEGQNADPDDHPDDPA
jgi:hypothetical protein